MDEGWDGDEIKGAYNVESGSGSRDHDVGEGLRKVGG